MKRLLLAGAIALAGTMAHAELTEPPEHLEDVVKCAVHYQLGIMSQQLAQACNGISIAVAVESAGVTREEFMAMSDEEKNATVERGNEVFKIWVEENPDLIQMLTIEYMMELGFTPAG